MELLGLFDNTIDLELDNADFKIESTLAEISVYMKEFTDQKTCDKKTLNQDKELLEFILKLLELFHQHPTTGFEELVLPHIGELKLQNALSFIGSDTIPCICDDTQNQCQHSERDLTSVWEQLCSHLEKYIDCQLSNVMSYPIQDRSEMRWHTWSFYLHKLRSILAPNRLWEFNYRMRNYHLESFKCPCFANCLSNQYCLKCLILTCLEYYSEDSEFISMGYFQPLVLTWCEVYNVYARKITECSLFLLDNIENGIKYPNEYGLVRQLKCFMDERSWCKHLNLNLISNSSIPTSTGKTNVCSNLVLSLLDVMELLLVFEKYVLANVNSKTKEKPSLKAMLMSLPSCSPEQSPLHQQTSTKDSTHFNLWDWRLVFADKGFLNALQRSLQDVVSQTVKNSCSYEVKLFNESRTYSTVTIPSLKTTAKYMVMCSASEVIKSVDKFLPALASSQGPLSPFYASFNHVLHTYLIDLVEHIEGIVDYVPYIPSNETFYAPLGTCHFLRERLQIYGSFYCKQIKGSPEESLSCIGSIETKLSNLRAKIRRNVSLWHTKVLQCGILFDAESYNWPNNRAFMEGESISYSLCMWNLYLKNLSYTLKQSLKSDDAQEIYTDVLKNSLSVLASRYSRAKPSEARTPQIRIDITFILLCTVELLPYSCSSLQEFITVPMGIDSPMEANHNLIVIHSSCCTLLVILSVVTSPISTLCITFKNGFPKVKKNSAQHSIQPWLPWLQPNLFPPSKNGSLLSSVSVWLTVKVCISQFQIKKSLILQALTSHSCTLAILLVTQVYNVTQDQAEYKMKLLRAIFYLLRFSNHCPCGIASVLIPVISLGNFWNVFDASTINQNCVRPWWYTTLSELVYPLIKDIISCSITRVLNLANILESNDLEKWKTFYLHMRQVVRCNCDEILAVDRLTAISLYSLDLLQCLAENVATLPDTVFISLAKMQNHLEDSDEQIIPLWGSLAIQLLIDVLSEFLRNDSLLEKCLGTKLSDSMIGMCSDIADCVLCLATPKVKFRDHDIPLWCLDKSKSSLSRVRFMFSNHEMQAAIARVELESQDACSELVLQSIEEDGKGTKVFNYLQEVLCLNIEWIQKSLGVPGLLSTDCVVNSVCPSPLDSGNTPSAKPNEDNDSVNLWIPESEEIALSYIKTVNDTNPRNSESQLSIKIKENVQNVLPLNVLEEFTKIGSQPYSFENIAGFKYLWDSLLSHLPLLGLTEDGFKTLLYNRWDLNNEEILPEAEKKCVQLLRKTYSVKNTMK